MSAMVVRQKQKQSTEQQTVNETQSLTLVRNLLRTGISTICYMRDIFPNDEFAAMEFNKTSIMALRPQSDDAHDLTRWLEKGAFEAIREKYLERLVLVIFEGDPRGSEANVIEEHSFRVCYPANSSGKAELEHTGQDTKQGQVSSRTVGKGTKDAVKKETTVFIRTLITVMQTMSPLPDTRYVSMRLHYNSTAPEEYEPECFRHVTQNDVKYFDEEPTTLAVGDINTNYHQLTMKVKMAEISETDELTDAGALEDSPSTKSEMHGHQTPDTQQESQAMISPEYDNFIQSAADDAEVDTDENDEFMLCVQWAQRQETDVRHHQMAKQMMIPPARALEYAAKMTASGILGPPRSRGGRAVLANQLAQDSMSPATQAAQFDDVESAEKENRAADADEDQEAEEDTGYAAAVQYASQQDSVTFTGLSKALSVDTKTAKGLCSQMQKEGLVGKYVVRKGSAVSSEAMSQYLVDHDGIAADDEEEEEQDQIESSPLPTKQMEADDIESSQRDATPTPSRRGQTRKASELDVVKIPQGSNHRVTAEYAGDSSDSEDYNGNGIVCCSQDSQYGDFGADAADHEKISIVEQPIYQNKSKAAVK